MSKIQLESEALKDFDYLLDEDNGEWLKYLGYEFKNAKEFKEKSPSQYYDEFYIYVNSEDIELI